MTDITKTIIHNVFGIEPNYRARDGTDTMAIETKLHIHIPQLLREYYALCAAFPELNYNDEVFRPQDVFIDEADGERYLVIGKQYWHGKFWGIKTGDLEQENPPVFVKGSIRVEGFHRFQFIWHNNWKCERLDKLLLYLILENGMSGALNYTLYADGIEAVKKICSLIENRTLDVQTITDMSRSFPDRSVYDEYYQTDKYILSILLISQEDQNQFGLFHLGTNDKTAFQRLHTLLKENGVKTETKEDPVSYYRIKTRPFSWTAPIFVPGGYENWHDKTLWRERRKDAILIPEPAISKFTDLLERANSAFDYYGISTEYNREQITLLVELLSQRINEMRNNPDFLFTPRRKQMNYCDYYWHHNIDFRKYKHEIIAVFQGFADWLNNVKEDRITVIGV